MTRKMKDSRVEWIGEIPEDWEVQNLKSILGERKEMNNPVKTELILSLTNDRGVIPYSEKGDIGNKSKEDLTKYKLAYPNDIVVNSMNVIIGSVGLSEYFGATSPVYYMLYVRDSKDSIHYYNYLFQTKEFQSKIVGYGNGIMEHRMRIPMINLNKVHFPYPDSLQQKVIVNFLDEKMQEIDNIIYKTKKAIEEYKKYKQSLITETVTKGLDKDIAMKDSGIEWMGNIPEHWNTIKLKYLYKVISGTTPINKDENWNGDILWVTPADYNTSDIFIKDSNRKITQLAVNSSSLTIIPKNSIIVSNRAPIGKIALNEKELTINQGCKALIAKKISNNKYTYYSLSVYSSILNMLGRGTTFLELSGRELGDFIISIPSLEEQNKIVIYLDEKCSKIDNIISTKEKLLTEMEYYKKSLIYETVTGKREVE